MPRCPQHFDGSIRIEAGLWFSYGKWKRPDVSSGTTFDAVMHGERVSTTRFLSWPGHGAWKNIRPGDFVLFHEKKDKSARSCVVSITMADMIDLKGCDEYELETWSRCEGWTPEKGRDLGRLFGPAIWFRHKLEWPQMLPKVAPREPKPTQMSMF